MKLGALVTGVLVLGIVGCGSDSNDDFTKRADQGLTDAGMSDAGDTPPDDDAPDSGPGQPPSEDAGDPIVFPMPPDIEPPDPILPDLPQDTPVSDLTDDQFQEVCDAYLESADRVLKNYGKACGVVALNDALEAEPETTEEFRELCGEARLGCEAETKAATALVGSLECNQDGTCQATVAEFNSCNQQISAVDRGLLFPLANVDVPPCEKLTPRIARAVQLEAFVALGGSLELIEEAMADDSACNAIQNQCPDFVVPLGGALP